MPVPRHNLTLDDCHCLDKIMATAGDKLELAKALQECGLPTEEFVSFYSTAIKQCQDLKAKLFPNEP